jgi:signal transduction histidine kinase
MRAATDQRDGAEGEARPIPVPDLAIPQAEADGTEPDMNRAGPAQDRAEPERPPWSQSAFWVLQLIVLALYLVRLAAIVAFHLDTTSVEVEFSTLALFLVPVVYAALHYGATGAVATSGWATVLALPRFFAYTGAHQYVAAWAELLQVALLNAMAILIGQAVSAEREARRQAESAREAHLSAEALYRDLFDSNQAPILIVDAAGQVVEANAAALRAFSTKARSTSSDLTDPVRLVDMIGPGAAAYVLTRLLADPEARGGDAAEPSTTERVEPVPFEVEGQSVLYRPAVTTLGRSSHDRRTQVVFEDVTTETRRHDLMEAYASRVVLGQEEERRHIAQELHDGPVQSLIHLCRQIDLLRSQADADSTGPRSLSELRELVEEAVGELRSISKGLRPSILDDLGLVASINQMLAESGARQGFVTSFGVTGSERRLPPATELALFRIAQEALSNIERHADPHRVAIGIDFESGALRLLIKDDGVGFEASGAPTVDATGSLGLPGMVERAHLIGARLVIHSSPGAGTTVDVSVPATIIG